MADLQKDSTGKNIVYKGTVSSVGMTDVVASTTPGTSLYLFLNGGVGSDGKTYPKVDMSVWDQATMCATCHVGGVTYEKDRNGMRLPQKAMAAMGKKMQGQDWVEPFTSTVWESYSVAGADTSFTTLAPWIYPQYNGNDPRKGAMIIPPNAANGSGGWAPMDMAWPNPNGGPDYQVKANQLMMPNVKEMDCLFCHFQGFDNVMSSVMAQAGSLNAAPAAGAGLFDMTPGSPTYMGYNGQNGAVAFTNVSSAQGNYAMVSFTDGFISKIKPKPLSNNCMQCHATGTLKDMPEMFGVTGASSGFLSSAPMIYDPAHAVGPLGKRMTAYDINAMWLTAGNSPQIDFTNFSQYMMPGLNYLSAMGMTPLSTSNPLDPKGYLGGGNAAKTGPLYYYNADMASGQDQNVMKRSVPVFARAEWFKRGDAWQAGQDVHSSFGCGGCHYTGDTANKNQCDPGRGFDMASTIQDGVPAISKKQVVKGYNEDGTPILAAPGEVAATIKQHDTRNTVKRCEFCHVTGKDYYGKAIDTFGAPNPNEKHATRGLLVNTVQIADKMDPHGAFGGQGISKETNFTSANTKLGKGNHLDVMDCTVCHVQKVSMAVRALDATSGMRYPSVVGTDPNSGMMGLFEDPAPDSFNAGAVAQYNGMYAQINTMFGYTGDEAKYTPGAVGSPMAGQPGPGYQKMIPAGTHVVGSKLMEWKPLRMWQKLGNMEAPLTTAATGASNGGQSQMNFRRKIYLANSISALIWNNTDANIDANGDTVKGGLLIGNGDEKLRAVKPSLDGYTDIFDGDAPDKNNTQGYGEPIYDPWVMRDLKAGMNFGPSALSVISVGFGDPATGAYGTAYNADGTFTGKWKYASVWSGAVTFTEPAEIAAYKAFRGPDWAGTKLSVVGAPFMVTHGVKTVSTYVKGTSCADCHAPNKEFFQGGFDMLGTAVPADATYDPTAKLNPVQNAATGDYDRYPGLGFVSASNLMERPLEPFRIKGLHGDLATSFEGFNKLGQPRTATFEGSDATYNWTKDLERAEVLYPSEDGAIYYKITDWNADGTLKAGTVAMNGQQYATYLETLSSAAAVGIGIDPVATITSITDEDATKAGIQVYQNKVYANNLVANAAVNTQGSFSYNWKFDDGTAAVTGATASKTFTKLGVWAATLEVTDEESKIARSSQLVEVIAVPAGTVVADPNYVVAGPYDLVTKLNANGELQTLNGANKVLFSNMPTHTKIYVVWGDGKAEYINGASDIAAYHKFLRYAMYDKGTYYEYKMTVYVYDGTVKKETKQVTIQIEK